MKLKIGVDIIYIPKFKKLLKNEYFINKVFHKTETKRYEIQHLAGIFATKEAFFKALGENPKWLDVEIISNGKPKINLVSKYKKIIKNLDISISHDKDYAIANVIIELK